MLFYILYLKVLISAGFEGLILQVAASVDFLMATCCFVCFVIFDCVCILFATLSVLVLGQLGLKLGFASVRSQVCDHKGPPRVSLSLGALELHR